MPGLGLRLDQTRLDLQYQDAYQHELPDAYERLLLDVVNGDKRLFIRWGLVCVGWGMGVEKAGWCVCVWGGERRQAAVH